MAETFGLTTKGASELAATGNRIWLCKQTSGSAGSLASITVYLKYHTGINVKCAIYNADNSMVANGTTEEKGIGAEQDGNLVFNFGETKPVVEAATDYYLATWFNDYQYFYYNAGIAGQLCFDNCAYDGWPDPWYLTNSEAWEFTIFATYEEAPPPAVKTLVQAALISIPPLIVLPTLGQILRFAGGC